MESTQSCHAPHKMQTTTSGTFPCLKKHNNSTLPSTMPSRPQVFFWLLATLWLISYSSFWLCVGSSHPASQLVQFSGSGMDTEGANTAYFLENCIVTVRHADAKTVLMINYNLLNARVAKNFEDVQRKFGGLAKILGSHVENVKLFDIDQVIDFGDCWHRAIESLEAGIHPATWMQGQLLFVKANLLKFLGYWESGTRPNAEDVLSYFLNVIRTLFDFGNNLAGFVNEEEYLKSGTGKLRALWEKSFLSFACDNVDIPCQCGCPKNQTLQDEICP